MPMKRGVLAYLRAESVHASDNLERAEQHCVLTEGHCREADSLARCSPPDPHPPSPSAEEPGVAQLLDHGLQSLRKYIEHAIHFTFKNWATVL